MIRTNLIIDLELEFDLALNSTSIKMTSYCISPNHSILPCHIRASYCCIALIVFLLYLSVLFPLDRCVPAMSSMTPMKNYTISEVPGNQNPLLIPIQPHSLALALALFYCIRATTIQLLHDAVVEPLSSA